MSIYRIKRILKTRYDGSKYDQCDYMRASKIMSIIYRIERILETKYDGNKYIQCEYVRVIRRAD